MARIKPGIGLQHHHMHVAPGSYNPKKLCRVLLRAMALSTCLTAPAAGQIDLRLFPPQYDTGRRVVINGVVTTPRGRIEKLAWDWGDGSGEESWFPASHTYDRDGSYTVSVMAQRDDRRVEMAGTRVYFSSALAGHRRLLERFRLTVYDILALALILTVIVAAALRAVVSKDPRRGETPQHPQSQQEGSHSHGRLLRRIAGIPITAPYVALLSRALSSRYARTISRYAALFRQRLFTWITYLRSIAPYVVLVCGALFSHDTRSSNTVFAYGFALVLFQSYLVRLIGGLLWMVVVLMAVGYLIANAFGLLDTIRILNIIVGAYLNIVFGNPRPSSGLMIGVIGALMFLYIPADWPQNGVVSRLVDYQPTLPLRWREKFPKAGQLAFELVWRVLSYAAGVGLLVASFRLLSISRLLAVLCALGGVWLWRQVAAMRCPGCGCVMVPERKSPFGDFDEHMPTAGAGHVGAYGRMLGLVTTLADTEYWCQKCGYSTTRGPHTERAAPARYPGGRIPG
jgi:hypothetical protein